MVLALVAGLAIGSNPKWSFSEWFGIDGATPPPPSVIAPAPEPTRTETDRAPEMQTLDAVDARLSNPQGLSAPLSLLANFDSSSSDQSCGIEDQFLSGLWMPDLPVTRDTQTAEYLRFFASTEKGRALVQTWLERGQKYRGMFAEALERRGLPRALEAVAFVESGLYERALSHAGAAGLWQLMPQTARAYGLDVRRDTDQRYEPTLATEAAVTHLGDLFDQFGRWDLALAAYNAGTDAIRSRLTRHGVDNFLALAEAGHLPRETALYVPKIFALAVVLQNVEHLGIGSAPSSPNPLGAPWTATTFTPRRFAQARGVRSEGARVTWGAYREDEVEPLDPHAFLLDRLTGKMHTVTPDGRTKQVRSAEEADAVQNFAAHSAELGRADHYVVQPGDALEAIARRQNVSVASLIEWNQLKNPSVLRTGQKLRILRANIVDQKVLLETQAFVPSPPEPELSAP